MTRLILAVVIIFIRTHCSCNMLCRVGK